MYPKVLMLVLKIVCAYIGRISIIETFCLKYIKSLTQQHS